jgi:hypothetical protein
LRSPAAPEAGARAWRRGGRLLAVAGLAAILVATLTPSDDPRSAAFLTPLLCLICGRQGGADVVANLLLFLPFATGLRLAGWSWRRSVAAAASVSFTVELLQYLVITGRDASLSDVLTNTASGAMGATLGGVLPALMAPSPARASRLLIGALAAPLALLAGSAWLLVSDMPRGRLMSRWAHVAPGIDVFDGRVQTVQLNGRVMPANGPPPDARRLRAEVAAGRIDLAADVTSGAPVAIASWIYMFRVPSGGAVTLSQLRRRAVFAVPARALRLNFFPPTVTLADAFPAEPGVPVALRAVERGRDLVLRSSYGGRTRSIALGITPAYGWILISPFQFGGGTERWMTALCLALLYLPAGYWAASVGRPVRAAAGLAAGIALALLALPPAAALASAPWTEWLGALAGAGLGWALRRAAAYLQTRCVSPSVSESSSP